MSFNPHVVRDRLGSFKLRELFNELGWDRHEGRPLEVPLDAGTFMLTPLAQKRGFQVFECVIPDREEFPDYALRGRIQRQAARSAHEHLIIFTDQRKTVQKWRWPRWQVGSSFLGREHTYYKGQPGESLVQKLRYVCFSIDDEDRLTLVDVNRQFGKAFNVADKVTKRFYERFKKEHERFLEFIQGIREQTDRAWYASLMLNRLMFVYFLQKKGFLADDPDYLRNRLHRLQETRGKDHFQTFYRYFLLRLFHEGLGKPKERRNRELEALLGTVPYLNGGLFDVHLLEIDPDRIQIPDEAFEKLFDFFDAYHWHLDDRPLRDDSEVNPDVLGYIFEKYINQKQMGAYYTREDITGYIARNTILPHILEAAARDCAIAFRPEGTVWGLLRQDPEQYLYPAMRKGVDLPLPEEIAAGLEDIEQRDGWNRTAPEDFGLPTETWREHVTRRQRYEDIVTRMRRGDVQQVADLVTLNLDVQKFAEDVIASCEGPETLRAIYKAVTSLSVLDPTCGSGAFLFAALNVLEPLYDACLLRMEQFITELDRSDDAKRGEKLADFRESLEEANRHPSRSYFIHKSIVVNNLFGVDIMEEAVEICKLRMFLKLVSQVDKVSQLEPLPDIDFNIRAGNTLVGFASLKDVEAARAGWLQDDRERRQMDAILKDARLAEDAFVTFRRLQTRFGADKLDFSEAKAGLQKRLASLRDRLDRYLAEEYGIDPEKVKAFAGWRASHHPFHWFAEFHGIMSRGGFDVSIGNPPWREYAAVRRDEYTVLNYVTEKCGNLHALCTERSLRLRHPDGRLSFIVQLPLASSSRMKAVRDLLRSRSGVLHVLSFDDRPGKLFDGLEHCRSVIFLSASSREGKPLSLATTRYHRWPTEAREYLFETVEFAHVSKEPVCPDQFPKSVSDLHESVYSRVRDRGKHTVGSFVSRAETDHFIFYQEATGYWVKATIGLPYYEKNGEVGAPAHGRYLYFSRPLTAQVICALMHSSLFYAYFVTYGDCFHLSDTLVRNFPIPESLAKDAVLARLCNRLMRELRGNAKRRPIRTRDDDTIVYDEYFASQSKALIDEIDQTLAKHYGFTSEELDFIQHFDAKYRMGPDAESTAEAEEDE